MIHSVLGSGQESFLAAAGFGRVTGWMLGSVSPTGRSVSTLISAMSFLQESEGITTECLCYAYVYSTYTLYKGYVPIMFILPVGFRCPLYSRHETDHMRS